MWFGGEKEECDALGRRGAWIGDVGDFENEGLNVSISVVGWQTLGPYSIKYYIIYIYIYHVCHPHCECSFVLG